MLNLKRHSLLLLLLLLLLTNVVFMSWFVLLSTFGLVFFQMSCILVYLMLSRGHTPHVPPVHGIEHCIREQCSPVTGANLGETWRGACDMLWWGPLASAPLYTIMYYNVGLVVHECVSLYSSSNPTGGGTVTL